jgi:hypothetical protein
MQPTLSAHIFCDTDNLICDVLTGVITQLTYEEQRPKSVSSIGKFLNRCPRDLRAVVAFDSFDLLESEAHVLFKQIEAIVDQRLLPMYSFIFVTHVDPQFFCATPLSFFNILFPVYTKSDIVAIVSDTLHRPDRILLQVVDICAPISRDIRDIIFVVHTLGPDIEKPAALLARQVLTILDSMRTQQMSRVNDLARTAAALLIAVYIGSRTSIASDLLRFARTVHKRKREPKLQEDHDTIPVERAYALAKSLIYSHLGDFDTDFSLNLQLQKLAELGLLELRGDLYGDPRVKCLANEQEVNAVARVYDIQLHEYLTARK